MEELDNPPSVYELCQVIDSLACGKAPGQDGILPEVVKAGKDAILLDHLYQLLLQCWEEGTLPQEMRDTDKVAFYNKEDRSDCNNYSSISLLNIVEKVRAQVRPNVTTKLAGQRSP